MTKAETTAEILHRLKIAESMIHLATDLILESSLYRGIARHDAVVLERALSNLKDSIYYD